MSKVAARPAIRLRGVRHNNLKNFDLDVPLRKLVVITGLSGSGKSSLAFDTLFAEGQRRYIETFSPYARQFFDRMDKPQVDSIEGIPPAIAIEQRNAVKSTRSTVGTMTEICDHMKLLWPQIAKLHCRQCGQVVQKDSPGHIWESVSAERATGDEVVITFDVPISEKLSLDESAALISKQGYQRLWIDDDSARLEDALPMLNEAKPAQFTIIQDRLKPGASRARFVEACEQAFHYGKGKLAVRPVNGAAAGGPKLRRFSNRLHCADCDLEYREPSPALFSFNHPVGACPACRGFGRTITIDYRLALPDRSRTLAAGVVKPWQTGKSAECQDDLMKFCKIRNAPVDVPFEKLAKKWQDWVINGDPDYGKDKQHEWPRAWYGIRGYFRWLESKSYKMHVRVLLSRYRSYVTCSACDGKRFQPEALLYKVPAAHGPAMTLSDFYQLPVRNALKFAEDMSARHGAKPTDPLGLVLHEVRSRLGYLQDVGLGYLTLDRPTRSLSGGETERVNLTSCLGTRLVNTLYVLDEPSVGLHPRDTQRLVGILEQLRDTGNTVVVVEHEAGVMRAADEIIDLGPGHGAAGGEVVFQGPFEAILKSDTSLTGKYLSGRQKIAIPNRRTGPGPKLRITGASLHNLQDLSVEIPLGRLVCITGVSGSGKTTLAREVLLPLLQAKLKSTPLKASAENEDESESESDEPGESGAGQSGLRLAGWETLGGVVLVDQSLLGKTPRSNPAVYIGAFDDVREVFADSELARQRGLGASAFSFNSSQGQCERCRGVGFEKIEMQFLSDVFIRCPECQGRRYRPHILEVKVGAHELSVGDLLESTVDEAVEFLGEFEDLWPAKRARAALELLREVGLGYLRLGQPINTLSGGESQRLKLVRHLAEWDATSAASRHSGVSQPKPTLFLFDEPTTGLHFEDVRVLLRVFQRLVDAGHSVVIIEHNLDVIKCADWVIDLGPEAGDEGGQIVAVGTPETIAACEQSQTGKALRDLEATGAPHS